MSESTHCDGKTTNFTFYSFFFPEKKIPESKEEKEEQDSQTKRSRNAYIVYFLISMYAIYLSFKCNGGIDPPDLLMACTFPTCYIFYKIGTDMDKCFPEINITTNETIKVLE